MSYLVFARKWRPQSFDDIVGQEHVTTTLKNAIKLNRVSQAYLFTGPRGVGKTSTARILAKALNCQKGPAPAPCNKCTSCSEITGANSLDVIEIDGASNRGIDEIRDLRENVKFAPVNGKFKIYIIDEVHQITEPAFNALLKTLEEPPAHVKFIFATTQPGKIPATILSRCQRFDFKRIPTAEIVRKLKEIADSEKIDADESVFFGIARAADGSMRDAESILDQLSSFCETKIKTDDVTKVLGIIEEELLLRLTDLIVKKDIASMLKLIDDLTSDGKDLYQFLIRFIEHIRNLSVLKLNKNLSQSLSLSKEMIDKLTAQGENFSLEDLIYFFYLLSSTYEAAKKSGLIRFLLEFAIIKIIRREHAIPIDELLERIKKLETDIPSKPVQIHKHNTNAIKSNSLENSNREEKVVGDNLPDKTENTSSSGSPELFLGDIQATWPKVIAAVGSKKASLASFLLEAELASFENGVLVICFPKVYQFHKEILEKTDNKKLVEGICADLFNSRIRIECKISNSLAQKNNFVVETEITNNKNEDPVIKDALDVFNGSIINNKGLNSNH